MYVVASAHPGSCSGLVSQAEKAVVESLAPEAKLKTTDAAK